MVIKNLYIVRDELGKIMKRTFKGTLALTLAREKAWRVEIVKKAVNA